MPPKAATKKRNHKRQRGNASITATTATTITTRPSKRQKIQENSIAEKALKQSLSALPDMPIDILFEIFSNVTPLDLLNLSRTTKAFRGLLLDRKSITVWKAARRRACRRWPDLPADISEPFWANLLFGDPVCEVCGGKNIRRVIFQLRRRICAPCLKAKAINAAQFRRVFPGYDPSTLDLLPNVPISGMKFYWESDVRKLLTALNSLQADVDNEKPDAEQILADFKQAHRTHVEAVSDHAIRCQEALAFWKNDALEDMQAARFKEIVKRFVALGFEEEDAKDVLSVVPMRSAPCTDRVFDLLRKELEPRLVVKRERRLEVQHKNIRQARRQIVSELYREYRHNLSPLQQDYLPDLRSVYGFRDILAVVNSDPTLQVTREDFANAMTKLPEAIQQWDADMEEKLKNVQTASTVFANWISIRLRRILDLNLAIFAVECTHSTHRKSLYRGDLAFGKRDALAHVLHNARGETLDAPRDLNPVHIKFSDAGATAVLSLIKALNMDESETTPDDLDEADARFLCLECHYSSSKYGKYRYIMNWRQAAVHFADSQRFKRSHGAPWWGRIVSERVVRAVGEVERRNSQDPATWIWRCNLCTGLDKGSKAVVLEHIRESHGITKPAIGRDYFTDIHGARPRKPVHRLLIDSADRSFEKGLRIWSDPYVGNSQEPLYVDNAP